MQCTDKEREKMLEESDCDDIINEENKLDEDLLVNGIES